MNPVFRINPTLSTLDSLPPNKIMCPKGPPQSPALLPHDPKGRVLQDVFEFLTDALDDGLHDIDA